MAVLLVLFACGFVYGYSLEIRRMGGLDITSSAGPSVSFEIVLHTSGISGLGNFGFNIYYDSAELTWKPAQSVLGSIPSPLTAGLFGNPVENTPGYIENISAALSPPNAGSATVSGDLTIATLVFDVKTGVADGQPDIWFDTQTKGTSFSINGGTVEMSAMPVIVSADADNDGIPDSSDNCSQTPNPGQQDTDGDGYGNACDADLDNNNLVEANDYTILGECWLHDQNSSDWMSKCRHADFDSNNLVEANDYTILGQRWLSSAPFK
jgi:hypothetical protein